MLTGTLVTVAGFLPIGFNGSGAGEYTYSLFVVIAAALLVSWVVAVLFAPLIGVTLLPKTVKHHAEKKGVLTRAFLKTLRLAMRWRWTTVGLCVGLMALAIVGMGHVQQQFFPPRTGRNSSSTSPCRRTRPSPRRRRRWTASKRL